MDNRNVSQPLSTIRQQVQDGGGVEDIGAIATNHSCTVPNAMLMESIADRKRCREEETGREEGAKSRARIDRPVGDELTCSTFPNPSNRHGHRKRPRTDRYLQELNRYESVQQTCSFFQRSLMAANASTSNKQVQANLLRQTQSHQRRFQSFSRSCLQDAQEALVLKESMICVQSAVASGLASSSSFPLLLLSVGHETTATWMSAIAAYAGIPSNADVLDCQELLVVAANREKR